MPKLKTHKAVAKRYKISGGKKKKILKRRGGQDHFNSRETSKTTRHKRKTKVISKSDAQVIKKLLPYS